MRFELESVAAVARCARVGMVRSVVGAAGLGRRSKAVFGGMIVAASAGIVASMVASVVLGPLGDQVLARNGDAARGPEGAGGWGGASGPSAGSLPAPRWTESLRTASPPRISLRASSGGHAGRGEGRRRMARLSHAGHVASARAPHAGRLMLAANRPSGSHSVCVRLCDGFFFPIGDVHEAGDLDAQTAVCSNACPGAPTRLYVVPSNDRDMSKAASIPDGKLYTALPVAFDHTKEVGPTCTCHAAGQADGALMSPMRDITLRNGDSVMTSVGWRVFKQTGHWPYDRANFTSLAAAGKMPAATRSTLVALENASIPHVAPLPPTAVLDIRKGWRSVGLKDGEGRMLPVREAAAHMLR